MHDEINRNMVLMGVRFKRANIKINYRNKITYKISYKKNKLFKKIIIDYMKLAKNLERLGTESAFSVLAEAKALEAKGNPMIHLGLGQPDFKTPKHVVEAAKKALDDGHHGYVMSNGIPECRQAVTRWIKKRYSVDVDFERILIMPGGKPTMSYAIQCFGEPGAEIIHPTPAFPIYESMINYTGSTSVPYDLTEDKDLKFNPEKILSLITDKTRLLILINPNNPTGSFVEKADIDVLAEGLKNIHM